MHFLPTYISNRLPSQVRDGRMLPRRFHFWTDLLPFLVWKLEKKLNLDLHVGRKFVKIYLSMRDRIASRLDPSNTSRRSNNHG